MAGGGADDKRDTAEWNSWLAQYYALYMYMCKLQGIHRKAKAQQTSQLPPRTALFLKNTIHLTDSGTYVHRRVRCSRSGCPKVLRI